MTDYKKNLKMRCTSHSGLEGMTGSVVDIQLDWAPFIPMEVRLRWSEDPKDDWVFARSLLAEGLVQPSGDFEIGDVRIMPIMDWLILWLISDDGKASYMLDREDVLEFLRPTVARVHWNDEPDLWVDWDVQMICLLAGAIDDE